MEELLQETLNDETNELREQLKIKDTKIKKNDIQNKINLKLDKHQILCRNYFHILQHADIFFSIVLDIDSSDVF